jgi:tRNA1Val (adenine37-N6)-methyltransferase
MSNAYFQFKQFTIHQDHCAMKVTTDACLFGAWVANEVKSEKVKVKNVLDIGTGTGLLSLMYAQKNANIFIDAIEIEKETYEQAKENITASPFTDRINLIHGDTKKFSFTKKYDLIISNPPFYEKELRSVDQKKNIALHNSGLSLEELLSVIKSKLSVEGIFYLLLPYKRNEEIKKVLFEKDLSILKIIFVKQSTNHDYFRIMLTGKLKDKNEIETIIDEISIWDHRQQYTEEFKELLKDYYLYL